MILCWHNHNFFPGSQDETFLRGAWLATVSLLYQVILWCLGMWKMNSVLKIICYLKKAKPHQSHTDACLSDYTLLPLSHSISSLRHHRGPNSIPALSKMEFLPYFSMDSYFCLFWCYYFFNWRKWWLSELCGVKDLGPWFTATLLVWLS